MARLRHDSVIVAERRRHVIHSTLLLLAGLASTGLGPAAPADTSPPARRAPAGLAARVWEITDAVLEHHVDPPARQEMILVGIKSLYVAAGLPQPPGLAGRVSALSRCEELAPLLDEAWAQLPSDKIAVRDVEIEPEDQLIDGLLEALPGRARLLSAQELKVEEQLAGNRYVGLHIALSFDREAKRSSIGEVFPGGPADRAGLLAGDLIEEIDGTSTEGLAMPKVIERLRGAEGSPVTIRVRQPKAAEARVLTITRGVLPQKTVDVNHKGSDGSTDVVFPWGDSIGYLKFHQILGSTPHELRVLARRLEEEGVKAVILDFRNVPQAHLHPTVLTADALLEGGTIGRMRTAHGVETFRAEPDALFPGLPLAMLVPDNAARVADSTLTTVRWLAAALQDNHRAIIIGPEDRRVMAPLIPRGLPPGVMIDGGADVRSAVPVGDGSSAIQMTTGRLERGDGRPMARAEGQTKGGLVPDIVTPAPARPQPRAVRPNPAIRITPRGDVSGLPADPTTEANPFDQGDAITLALKRLREKLKSP
jgi:carboxyl-terminal processing protease